MLTVLESRTPAAQAFRFPHRHYRLITVNFKDALSIKTSEKKSLYTILNLTDFELGSILTSSVVILLKSQCSVFSRIIFVS